GHARVCPRYRDVNIASGPGAPFRQGRSAVGRVVVSETRHALNGVPTRRLAPRDGEGEDRSTFGEIGLRFQLVDYYRRPEARSEKRSSPLPLKWGGLRRP